MKSTVSGRWRKLYVEPPTAWQSLRAVDRGIGCELLRRLDNTCRIPLRGKDPAHVVGLIIGAHPEERRSIKASVGRLMTAGVLTLDRGDLVAAIPDLEATESAHSDDYHEPMPEESEAVSSPLEERFDDTSEALPRHFLDTSSTLPRHFLAKSTCINPRNDSASIDREEKRREEEIKNPPSPLAEELTLSVPEAPQSDRKRSSELVQVFEHWVRATGRDLKRARFNARRRSKVMARFREGYTLDDLKAAVDGILRSPWHQGENPDAKRYDDLELICRDGAQVEKFRDMAHGNGHPAAKSSQSVAPVTGRPDEILQTEFEERDGRCCLIGIERCGRKRFLQWLDDGVNDDGDANGESVAVKI
jgi:hypothetical protein